MDIRKVNFKKINIKKVLTTALIVFLAGYVSWDISSRMVSHFRLQGYTIAVSETMRQAKNEDCYPFSIFFGEEEINLINVDCLQQNTGMEEMIVSEE